MNAIGASDPSATSSAFIVGTPGAPVIAHVVSGFATGSRGPLNVTFNPGPVNGNAVSAYRATCRQDFTGVPFVGTSLRSPITIGNLLTGHGYTCSVVATNAHGTSPTSNSVHTIVGTPAVPPVTHVLPIRNGVVLPFGTPASTGGSPIAYYQVHCASPNGGKPNTSLLLVSPAVANNLTVGRTYSCTVVAVNARGGGAPFITGPFVVRDPAAAGLPREYGNPAGDARAATHGRGAAFPHARRDVRELRRTLRDEGEGVLVVPVAVDQLPDRGRHGQRWVRHPDVDRSRRARELRPRRSTARLRFHRRAHDTGDVPRDGHVAVEPVQQCPRERRRDLQPRSGPAPIGDCPASGRLNTLVVSAISMTIT